MLNAVLQRLVEERGRVHEDLDRVMQDAADEERDPSESEQELLKRHRSRLEELEPQIEELLRTEETRQNAADARAFLTRTAPKKVESGKAPADPETDEVVYRSFGQYARDEIISRFDKIANRAGPGAREAAQTRLTRAVANTLTSDIPGLLPTQHLAQIIDVIAKARPVVSASRQLGLTAGQITYPKITSRPIVGEQTAEKTELPSQKMAVAMQTANAKVYGGAGDLSWQDVVWANPDALTLWFDLAAEAYAKTTEGVACAELGSQGNPPVVVASSDLAGWMGALTEAAGIVYETTGRTADTIATDITTGYALLGLVSSEAPVFIAAGSGNLASGTGTVAGLKLVISPGFAGTAAFVFDSQALLSAENGGAPVELRAVEPSIAGFEVGVVGAFVAEVMEPGAVIALTPPVLAASANRTRAKASE